MSYKLQNVNSSYCSIITLRFYVNYSHFKLTVHISFKTLQLFRKPSACPQRNCEWNSARL